MRPNSPERLRREGRGPRTALSPTQVVRSSSTRLAQDATGRAADEAAPQRERGWLAVAQQNHISGLDAPLRETAGTCNKKEGSVAD